jgi:3-hydroxybutyryl-CoA dehydrogenase
MKLGVIGAGTMGCGIAQLAAQTQVPVTLFDTSGSALENAKERILKGLARGVKRRKLTEDAAADAAERIAYAGKLTELGDCDVIVEAIVEDLNAKQALFRDLDGFIKRDAVLATNTSSLSIGQIAEAVHHPERVVGMHFFNPPVAMRLVEIIRHAGASGEAFSTAFGLAKTMGRTPVEVKDTPGFLVNRVVRSYYLVAQRLAAEGAGTFQEIDAAVKAQGNVPMGPFELMDFIGLEVNLKITHVIYEGLGKPQALKPHAIQEDLVAGGGHGRKNGKGFYLYAEGAVPQENPAALGLLPKQRSPLKGEELWARIMEAIHGEAQRVVAEGVADEESVDTAVRLAMNFPMGPFEWRRRSV